jgi:hypothetical protein
VTGGEQRKGRVGDDYAFFFSPAFVCGSPHVDAFWSHNPAHAFLTLPIHFFFAFSSTSAFLLVKHQKHGALQTQVSEQV